MRTRKIAVQEGNSDGTLLLAKAGTLEVRLASGADEIKECQRLRYEVFYEEMSAKPIGDMGRLRLDFDKFDAIADHLMVVDLADPARPQVVGTYRLIRQEIAEANGGFYTAGEYDIGSMIASADPSIKFLELGRSCVHKNYRNRPTINLLWQGLGQYVARFDIGVLFGCASFPGTDPASLALPLSFLYHYLGTPPEFRVRALPDLHQEMNLMPKDEIKERAALRALPPLIRGYVHAGCVFGDGAVIDEQFSTVDVFVMSIIKQASDRYLNRFVSDLERD